PHTARSAVRLNLLISQWHDFQSLGAQGFRDASKRRQSARTRHDALTTVTLTGVLFIQIPKGFFPIQDAGLISGLSEAAQDVTPKEMMRLQQTVGEILLRDPDIEGFGSNTGSGGGAQTANTGRFFIVLKPRDERDVTAPLIIDRLRPQLATAENRETR